MPHFDPQWNLRDPQPNQSSDAWQIRAEITPRWIRVKSGDTTIADSKRVLMVTEVGKLPVYYFPKEDVSSELLLDSAHRQNDPNKGEAVYRHLKIGDTHIENAAWSFPQPTEISSVISGYVSFIWRNEHISWFEEEEQVFNHARDPYSRLDALPSSRHVQVVIGGQIVAESRNSVVLFETGLTPRYYLPKEDINFDYLIPSDTITRCPYKGFASYYSFENDGQIVKDVLWTYLDPLPEVHEIVGRLSFYNEVVEAIYIDGEKWSLKQEDRLPYGPLSTKK
jgi:uncharacterized protein (DUF427 family)